MLEGISDAPEVLRDTTNTPETLEGISDAPEVLRDTTDTPETLEGISDAPEVLRNTTDMPEITSDTIDKPKVQKVKINIEPVPQGKCMKDAPKYVVVSAVTYGIEVFIKALSNPKSYWGIDLFIGLDGKVTCFVPNDAQLENAEKFASKAEDAREMRDRVKDIKDSDDYTKLAAYLMHGCYATELSRDMEYGWGGKTGCANFSINILLETIMYFMLRQNEQLDAAYNIERTFSMSDRVPYTDE